MLGRIIGMVSPPIRPLGGVGAGQGNDGKCKKDQEGRAMKTTVKRWVALAVFDGDPPEFEREDIELYNLRRCRDKEFACKHCEFMSVAGPTKAQVRANCIPVRVTRDPGPPRRVVIEEIVE